MNLPSTPSFRLDGKRAFVAGGSRGIGLGCAVALAQQGATVTIAARSSDQVDATAQAMQEAGYDASGITLDITDLDAVKSLMSDGQFDIMCNSAGYADHQIAFDMDEANFDKTISINLKAAYFLATEAARHMVAKGGGSIIQISSQMGHMGGFDRTVYCAAKHGMEGFTKAMAMEWGKQKVRINTICPTFVRTELTKQTFERPERVAWMMERIKLDRVAEVEDMMGAVAFLASDASAMVTGTSIMVDGGWTAG
ncbi:MAG: SDR family NAD(P)-dependent oxidoreductase [Planktomarina sp.]